MVVRNRWTAAAAGAVLLAVLAGVMVARASGPDITDRVNWNFTTQQRNHFGDPAKGFVIAEEWATGRLCCSAGSSIRSGCSRWFVASKAKRVLIHSVTLRDAETFEVLVGNSGSKNSNGAPLVELCTEGAWGDGGGRLYYVDVVASIRWADDTLSSRVSFGSTVVNARGDEAP